MDQAQDLDPKLEKELLARAATDKKAFAQIYEHYYPKVKRFIGARLPYQAELAEDLASQVFEKTLQALPKYEWREFGFGPWVYRIAKNVIIDHVRRASVRKSQPMTEAHEETTPSDSDPVKDIEAAAQSNDLHAILSSLPDRERRVVYYKFFDGFNNRQISRLMDISETNVGTIVYRVLQRLRRRMR